MTKVKNSPLKHKEGNIDAHKVSGAYFGEDKFHEINPDIVEVEEVKPSEIVESVEGYVKLKRKEAEVKLDEGEEGVDINYIAGWRIPDLSEDQIIGIQKELIARGANLGSTGADGDWGPISTAAFDFFKQAENKKDLSGFKYQPPVVQSQKTTGPYQKSNALKDVLKELVETAANPKYKDSFGDHGTRDYWSVIGDKFGDLEGYDKDLLNSYIGTALHSKKEGDDDYNWEEINETFENDFNFLEPAHKLANKNGRGTDGIVERVGTHKDIFIAENDQYNDGLADNVWYEKTLGEDNQYYYRKSSDEGNTWSEMSNEEIDLYLRRLDRSENNKLKNQTQEQLKDLK